MSKHIEIPDIIGKPFKRRGRGPDNYDCWGVVMEMHRHNGKLVPDYGIDALAARLIAHVYDNQPETDDCWRKLSAPEPLAVVALRNCNDDPELVNHFGVCIGAGKFVHVLRQINVSIERLSSPAWKNRIAGYHRYIG